MVKCLRSFAAGMALFVQSGGDAGGGFLLLILVFALYFLPTILGWKKSNRAAIFALNFFLGWTLIGWVMALVWSLTTDAEPTQVIVQRTAAPIGYCPGCGKPLEPIAQFCSSCGKPVGPATSTPIPAAPPPPAPIPASKSVSSNAGMSSLTKALLWGGGAILLLLVISSAFKSNTSDKSSASASAQQPYVLPGQFFLKPVAERGSEGEVYISGTTNLPDGMKMWVILGRKRAQQDAFVKAGKFRSGSLYPNAPITGTQPLEITAMFNGAWQDQTVLSLVGEGGKNLHGSLFKLTDPDVIDSSKMLEATFTVGLPPVPPEVNAISIAKHAILTVPDMGRSSTDIEENIGLFLKPGSGVTQGRGWSATPAGSNAYNVVYDFIDASNGEQQAIWSVNTVTKQVKYVNQSAKYFSWSPNY